MAQKMINPTIFLDDSLLNMTIFLVPKRYPKEVSQGGSIKMGITGCDIVIQCYK